MSQPPRRFTPAARDRSNGATSMVASNGPFHPRNRHQGRYDFPALLSVCPALASALIKTPAGDSSIDFSRPPSVRLLNQALMKLHYGIAHWEFPAGYLCPPIPGRVDYLHALADLLAGGNGGQIPRGSAVRVLDIGVGASCIYPLLGHREYGWQFAGSDIDPAALASASAIIDNNPGLHEAIELRRQFNPSKVFSGLLRKDDFFDLSLCNPPFHASAAEACAGSERKWRQLGKSVPGKSVPGKSAPASGQPLLNFGGKPNELWCRGGERGFLRQMIAESAEVPSHVLWFSSLVSKAEHLPALRQQLRSVAADEVRIVAMAQGNKQSRFIAWTFQDATQRQHWRQRWH
ncbi:MAG: 23S rRNA (adenine(1618)-N(6))-methyltransferase RlmF [Pseudomarimonas sp.]